jgi:protein O-mannosyl-transferase
MILHEQPPATKREPWISGWPGICLLLAVVTLVVWWPVVHCDFLNCDDPDYFTSNPRVQTGLTWANMGWAFTTGFASNWHPLTWLSLMLDAELSGKGPIGPHFTNLLFHTANTVLLFLLLRRLTCLREDASARQAAATWRSALVAALFALHPLHVESVAWVSERKDVLSTFFGLLSLLAYTNYAQRLSKTGKSAFHSRLPTSNYFLALFFFALGLMAKPMLVTLPLVMLLLDFWPLERMSGAGRRAPRVGHLVLEKSPFFVLSAVSCVVTIIVQQKGGAVAALVKIPMTSRMENAFVSYGRYLGKTFWPDNLAVLYPHPIHWGAGPVVLSLMLFTGLSVAAVWFGRKFPFALTGWFWFVVTLVPVMGLVQVGLQSMADRYAYLPLIGVFVVLVWGLDVVRVGWLVPRSLIISLAMIVLIACAVRTRDQLRYWQNAETLFRHTLAVTHDNYLAYNNLGTWLSKEGRTAEALDCFHQALNINPDSSEVRYNLGNAFLQLGDWDGAIDNYRRALQITPGQADILDNLGLALAAKRQYAGAITNFEAALKVKPDYADAHNNLAAVFFIEQRFNEAAQHYREALRQMPDDPRIYANLGDTLVRLGQISEAAKCYQEALRLKPDYTSVATKLQSLNAKIPK